MTIDLKLKNGRRYDNPRSFRIDARLQAYPWPSDWVARPTTARVRCSATATFGTFDPGKNS